MYSRGRRLYAALPPELKDIVDGHLFAEIRIWRRSADYLSELVAGLMQRHARRLCFKRDHCACVDDCMDFLRTSVTGALLAAFVPVTPLERSAAQWIGLRRALRRASSAEVRCLARGQRPEANMASQFNYRYMVRMALI